MGNRHHRCWGFVASGLAAAYCSGAARATEPAARNFNVHIGERITQEDNLYRLPEGLDPAAIPGVDVSREDVVNSTSIGLAGRWGHGEQGVTLDTEAAANRFSANEHLDNTSGSGALDWNWRFGGRWSGQVGGRREVRLASFEDTLSLAKDLLDTRSYHLDAGFGVGARWRALARAGESRTSHDDERRRRDDVESRSGAVGLEYRSRRDNTLGFEYRETQAAFPAQALVPGEDSISDYKERGADLNLGYALTDEVLLEASVGYLERTYALAPLGDFAGNVWSAALRWSPTESTQIALRSWRELEAHLDAESDHFVSTGEGLVATWLPVAKVGLSLQATREQQRYIGADVGGLVDTTRHDTPIVGGFRVTYTPHERASLEVAYRDETRDSNRLRFDYEAAAVSIAGEVRF